MKTIIANIRYSDDKTELEPLFKMGVKYVKRFGDTKTAYYELDYNALTFEGKKFTDVYNYAPLGKELPESFFNSMDIEYINSIYLD